MLFRSGTFAFAGLVVMWVAVNAAELLDRINKLDFKAIGVTIGILYIAFMAVYIFVTIVVYTARYKAGRREVRKYANHLKAVGRIYSREEKNLEGTFKSGDTVLVGLSDDKLTFSKSK